MLLPHSFQRSTSPILAPIGTTLIYPLNILTAFAVLLLSTYAFRAFPQRLAHPYSGSR